LLMEWMSLAKTKAHSPCSVSA